MSDNKKAAAPNAAKKPEEEKKEEAKAPVAEELVSLDDYIFEWRSNLCIRS